MKDNLKEAFEMSNIFYIHFHKKNIGTRANGASLKDFNALKKQMALQVKAQYTDLYLKNMKVPKNATEALGAAMDLDKDGFITKIDNEIKKNLQNGLSVDKLQSLLYIRNNEGGNSLNKCLRNAINEEDIQQLNEGLKILSECIKLLGGSNSAALAATLINAINENPSNRQELGERLSSQLATWQVNNNLKTIKKESLISVHNQLQNLASVLYSGHFKSGSKITGNGLVTLVSNGIISTSIAEGLAFSMRAEVDNLLHDTIIHSVGDKNSAVLYGGKEIKMSGKADVSMSNVKVNLEGIGNQITLNLGISSKFYTGQSFIGADGVLTGSYSSGSGGTLGDALAAVFPGHKDRYLAYNYMAHGMHSDKMGDLILTRQLARLFATSGASKDFAQYMLINGRVISIWQLIQYAISNNLSGKNDQEGISLTISNQENFKSNFLKTNRNMNSLEAAWARSKGQNNQINSAKIYAKLHLDNLARAMGSAV